MEPHLHPNNQETAERPKGQPRKPLRFRLIKLEERIAPGGLGSTKKCATAFCYSIPSW